MKAKRLLTYALILLLICPVQTAVAADEIIKTKSGDWDTSDSFQLRGTPQTTFKKTAEGLELSSGEVLVEVIKQLKVSAPQATLDCKKKSLILCKIEHGLERYLVLWTEGTGAVTVESGQHSASLGPGDEAIVSDRQLHYREIMKGYGLGRRKIKVFQLSNGNYLTKTEFSLLQALENAPLLYELRISSDPHDRIWKDRIMKTAAVLGVVTKGHGIYSQGPDF